MPPFSKELWEEGAQFKSFKLVKEGKFDEEGVTAALNEPGKYPGCSPTRTLRDVSSQQSALTTEHLRFACSGCGMPQRRSPHQPAYR